ncbi:MAG: FlgO family outer membrane protein [Bdellovibrionota bacterium]
MALVILALISTGCNKRYSDTFSYNPFMPEDEPDQTIGRFKSSYIVTQIDNYYRGTNPGPIGVTTFVNIDDLNSTSTFGRMYGEQVMSELSMRGFDVVELRHADALHFLSSSGEFALSRDVASVRRARDLGGIVAGTYVVSPDRVYVNARLIDPATSIVLSAGSVEMNKTKELAKMLRGGAFPATLERIPVKHLGMQQYPMPIWGNYGAMYNAEEMYPMQQAPMQPKAVEPVISK